MSIDLHINKNNDLCFNNHRKFEERLYFLTSGWHFDNQLINNLWGVTFSLYHYMYNFLTLSCLFFSEEPKFVGSYMIPDNEDRDDNKMYFFFTEKALEAENNAHTIYTRVGRLCVVRLARPWRYALFPQFTSLTSLCIARPLLYCFTLFYHFVGSFESSIQHALIIFVSRPSTFPRSTALPYTHSSVSSYSLQLEIHNIFVCLFGRLVGFLSQGFSV